MTTGYYQVLKFKIIFLAFSFLVTHSSFAERLGEEQSQLILNKGKIIDIISATDPYEYSTKWLTTYHVLYKLKVFVCFVGYDLDKGMQKVNSNKVSVVCKDNNWVSLELEISLQYASYI